LITAGTPFLFQIVDELVGFAVIASAGGVFIQKEANVVRRQVVVVR
jgi:hypothetical protein